MIAASVWSLLIPAMDMSSDLGKMAFVPAAVGFLLGIAFCFYLIVMYLICIWIMKKRVLKVN